jgi:stearoyl-CoA desaturase (Delta-9 desaturase)
MSKAAPDAQAPINKPAAIMFALTTPAVLIVPAYAWFNEFSAAAFVFFGVIMAVTGLSITVGYHRLWAHRAFEAHWALQLFHMLFGAMALQNSILVWASTHRRHHKDVDDVDRDPYSIKRGLWFAHIGWMLRDYPSGAYDFASTPDLLKNRIVMFQHDHYLGLAVGMNVIVPLALGYAFGDPWGFLLLGGLLRLVVNHHTTFFINSLAHWWGRRPYSTEHSARDNDFIALLTYGEGYHNFHHEFQWDYRNGIRWWQFDPTKWWIWASSRVGLARALKRVPEFSIKKALLQREFEEKQAMLARAAQGDRLAELQLALQKELEAFHATLAHWQKLQAERFEAAKKQLADTWENSEVRRQLRALEDALHLQLKRVRALDFQAA